MGINETLIFIQKNGINLMQIHISLSLPLLRFFNASGKMVGALLSVEAAQPVCTIITD